MRMMAAICLLLLPLVAQSQALYSIQFAFKDIPLDSEFAVFPSSYKDDCTPTKANNTFFCLKHVEVGSISMDAEFYFRDNRLAMIEGYFPREKFDLVFMAVAKKYGKYQERNAKQYIWRSFAPSFDLPPPDVLTLIREADSLPIVQAGQVATGQTLAVIRYESLQSVRDHAAARAKSEEKEIGKASKDL